MIQTTYTYPIQPGPFSRATLKWPQTPAMSKATRNYAQISIYFIPGQPLLDTFKPLSYGNQDHRFMGDFMFPVLKQEAQLLLRLQRTVPAQTTSNFNSAYLFWRPLFLTLKSTGLPTTGNTPNACSTLLYLFILSHYTGQHKLPDY